MLALLQKIIILMRLIIWAIIYLTETRSYPILAAVKENRIAIAQAQLCQRVRRATQHKTGEHDEADGSSCCGIGRKTPHVSGLDLQL